MPGQLTAMSHVPKGTLMIAGVPETPSGVVILGKLDSTAEMLARDGLAASTVRTGQPAHTTGVKPPLEHGPPASTANQSVKSLSSGNTPSPLKSIVSHVGQSAPARTLEKSVVSASDGYTPSLLKSRSVHWARVAVVKTLITASQMKMSHFAMLVFLFSCCK